jgi:TATA-box binding protein (TBP) (component of TFIID and TFIIIB)
MLNISKILNDVTKKNKDLITKEKSQTILNKELSQNIDASYLKLSDDILSKFKPIIETIVLPHDLKISTMTITCNFNCTFNISNIGTYASLTNNVIFIKFSNDISDIRSLDAIKPIKITKKPKRVKRMFYNQATIKIKTKYKTKPTNVKLFKNGAIQMTGCISIENSLQVLRILCDTLLEPKYIMQNDKLTLIEFVTEKQNLEVMQVRDFKINMINSNFNIGYIIDRNNLYQILLRSGIECTYEPCVHACVNLRYKFKKPNKKTQNISIFVFESGAVIVTGALNNDHLTDAHTYITKTLCENYNKLVKINIDDFLQLDVIQKMLKK